MIDVGGGDSRLVDRLIERGYECMAVLDVSGAALARARDRLGADQARVAWIEADVTGDWDWRPVGLWHDRAVFHFLTDAADRARYVDHMTRVVAPHGHVIIATFALDGPERCSGLPVCRYSADALRAELGSGFDLEETVHVTHTTPAGGCQPFCVARFRRSA